MAGTTHLRFERDIAELQRQIDGLRTLADEKGIDVVHEIEVLRNRLASMTEETYRNLAPMERVQGARHPNRPYMLDYVERVFTDWIELHGDRSYRDDQAIVAGWACLDGQSLMVIGQQKGRAMKENLRRNFGMPHPEGYRKALRLMKMAEKFGRPVVTVIDTPGVRAFGLWHLDREGLRHAFPEFVAHADRCRFRDCGHLVEPECGVRAAVEAGHIPAARFAAYERIHASLE